MTDLINEASLMAYADGELDEAAAAAVERAAANDPRLARRIAEFLRSRRLTRAAIGTAGLPPVPEEMRAAILAGAGPMTAGRRPTPIRRYAVALAAAAVLVIGFLVADGITSSSSLGDTVALLESDATADLLDTAASGEERTSGDTRLRAVATYRLPSGEVCREIHLFRDVARLDTIECRDGTEWAVRLIVFDPDDTDSYTPASGDDPIDAYLTRVGAGEPLSGEAEMSAIQQSRS